MNNFIQLFAICTCIYAQIYVPKRIFLLNTPIIQPLSPLSLLTSTLPQFNNTADWAQINKLIANTINTEEIVFHHPHLSWPYFFITVASPWHWASPICWAPQSLSHLCSVCGWSHHFVLHTISQRFYLLHQLKKQGLPMSTHIIIVRALVVSRIE